MNLNYGALVGLDLPKQLQSYTDRDTMLFALSAGIGDDPVDPRQLQFVYERQLVAMPAMAHILAMASDWLFDPANGIDLKTLLHVESGLSMSGRLPPAGTVSSRLRITRVTDRGAGKGAVLAFERAIANEQTNEAICTVSGTFLLRGNGGFGGPAEPRSVRPQIPQRLPDTNCTLPTSPRSALLYRLNQDRNPIHVDPEVAARAGFPRPILHGACTYAVAMHALLAAVCDYETDRVKTFNVRFSAPLFPGETVRTDFWETEPGRYLFQSRCLDRDVVVLDDGLAEVR